MSTFRGILMVVVVMVAGMNTSLWAQPKGKSAQSNRVEVLYFHGKQRCMTCNAIEKLSREVVQTSFANEVKKGTLVFKVVDISKPENEKLADSYEVTWSSLFVNSWRGGKESRKNMTEYAFSYAKNSPDVFKAGLVKALKEQLK
ncbi:nitrophenyl compound nitroreductase subunit ArsF family protein [Alistipes sp. ZOR0009]|uniref:nitrophenyl compound nitroreductase subunit ArsF family protein n=1 Tax=Alistipes sp. ZOR0009 TaxID=1339253 RepID=UPI0006462A74